MNGPPASLLTYNLMQLIALPATPLFLSYLACRKKYRRQIPGRLGLGIDSGAIRGKRPLFWVHALSIGEINAATPLIEAIISRWPEAGLVCSATTATGIEALEKRFREKADLLLCPPFDFWITVKRCVDAVKPDMFILTETDVWPNWLWYLKKLKSAMLFVNASLSSRAARNIQKTRTAKLLFGSFDIITPQSKDDLARFSAVGIGLKKLRFLGNLKYDRKMPRMSKGEKMSWRNQLGLRPDLPVLVFGSTHPGEEEIIFKVLASLRGTTPFQAVIAPRDPARGKEVAQIGARHSFEPGLKSRGIKPGAGENSVVILDTLGELLKCYAVASIAFVGGSLVPTGGHNLLEPACYGVPVLFGPHVESTRDVAQALRERRGGMEVTSQGQMKRAIETLLEDKGLHGQYASAANQVAGEFSGSLSKHVELMEGMLAQRGLR